METSAFYKTTRRPKRKRATVVATANGGYFQVDSSYCAEELSDLRKRLNNIETTWCSHHTDCRELLDGITQRLDEMEHRSKAEDDHWAHKLRTMEERLRKVEELLQRLITTSPASLQ